MHVDNLTESEACRLELIHKIQELSQLGYSVNAIAGITGKERKTVKKYMEGDPEKLCKSNKCGSLDTYKDFIIKCIMDGITQSKIAEQLLGMGYQKSKANARLYITSVAQEQNLELAKYCNTPARSNESGKSIKADYITRKSIFNYLWMNGELEEEHYNYLWTNYPILKELETVIRQFREIFNKKNMPLLYLFINRYKNSSVKKIASFANGLEKDIEAIGNAVAIELSNGFVEGTNSKLKMIKRTMYGRCGKQLLAAKLMYQLPSNG